MGIDDHQLLKKIKSDNEKAFEQLFEKYYEPLVRFAYRYVGSVHIAEELVQDVFAVLWEDRKKLDTKGSIKSFLYQSTRNNALDHIRHQKVVEKYEELVVNYLYDRNHEIELIDSTGEEFRIAVQDAIEELPEQTKYIYKLSRKDGLTYKEISSVLGISDKTVESHMSKALSILRRKLSKFISALAFIAPFFKNVS